MTLVLITEKASSSLGGGNLFNAAVALFAAIRRGLSWRRYFPAITLHQSVPATD